MALEHSDAPACDAEDVEEGIPEGFAFGELACLADPFCDKGVRARPYFVPGEGHRANVWGKLRNGREAISNQSHLPTRSARIALIRRALLRVRLRGSVRSSFRNAPRTAGRSCRYETARRPICGLRRPFGSADFRRRSAFGWRR